MSSFAARSSFRFGGAAASFLFVTHLHDPSPGRLDGASRGVPAGPAAFAGADAALGALLFETAAAGVALLDHELRYVRVNAALAAMNGVPVADHVGRTVHDVLPPAAADALAPLLRRVLETGEPVVDLAFVADVPGGHGRRHFLATYYPVHDAAGGVTGVAGFVAERTSAEAALRETESRLRRVAESGIVGLFFWSMDGGISEANDAFLSMLGYTQADLAAGRVDWRQMTPPEYVESDEVAVRELLTTGRHGQVVKEYFAKDGRRVPVVVTSAMLDGSTDRGVCVCLDDTARRAAEARLARVLAQTPAAVAVLLGPDHVVYSANEMFMRVLGRRDYVGRPAREGAPELVAQGFIARMDDVYRTGAPYQGREAPLVWDRDGDGTLHEGFFDFVYQPIIDAAGAVEGVLVFAVEVTAQVHARREIERTAQRTERLQALTAALAAARTVDEVAGVVVAQVVAAAGATTGALVLRVPESGEAVIVRQTGLAPDVVAQCSRFPVTSSTPAGRCLRTGEPQWAESREELLARFPESADLWARLGTHALATVPLAVAGESIGAMSFTFAEPRTLDADDRAFFLALGRQAAQALERARLLAAERRARGEAEAARERTARLQELTAALSTASTLDEVARAAVAHATAVVGAVGTVIARLSADGEHLEIMGAGAMRDDVQEEWRRFPLSAPVPLADAARTGQPIFLESRAAWAARYPHLVELVETSGHHANAVMPLVVDGRVHGVLGAAFDAPRTFDEDDRAQALAVARQCAQALERARLYADERAARAAAEAARAEAEAANRAKGEFLAVMSHELRTPLNAIGGYAELMEMGIRGPVSAQQREDLARIQQSQRHLLGLINEVLNYAKLETGTVRYDVAAVRVRDAVAEATGLVAPQARAKGLALAVADCAAGLTVRADAEKLRQILVNLLSNAVKFTDAGGRIEVSCGTAQRAGAVIRVRDTGIGIAADQLERIFEPFVQVRADLTRTAEGTGLGLAISRDLARGMGGDLTVESAPGAGSTFTITLPRDEGESGETTA